MKGFSAIQIIAEAKIREAEEKGLFDNLAGAGKPLIFENMDNVPQELRMAYKILKNAGCVPKEIAGRREMASLTDLLENCEDEKTRLKAMKRLRLLLSSQPERLASLEGKDEYLNEILARLEKQERKTGNK